MLSQDMMGYCWEFRQEAQEARLRLSTFSSCRSSALHVTQVLTRKHFVLGSLTAEEMIDQISFKRQILFCLLLEQDKQGTTIRYLC